MGQFLRIAIVLFGLWLILRLVKRALAARRPPPAPAAPTSPDMLRCEYCGIFVPRDEAITARTKVYCCDKHANPGLPNQ